MLNLTGQTKKTCRDRYLQFATYVHKQEKALARAYQREHEGVDPRLVIPRNTFYCYQLDHIEYRGAVHPIIHCKVCPHWYAIEIPENERETHPCIVAEGQTHIGGCKFLNEVDTETCDLLWDQCKLCSIE